jgi:hypothetical protein
MQSLSPIIATLTKTTKSMFSGLKVLFGLFNNIRMKGFTQDYIQIIYPYGSFGVPNSNIPMILIPLNDSQKSSWVALGTGVVFPTVPHEFIEGESASYSNKYVLAIQNDKLVAYRISDNQYQATLISGEWTNKILADIIEDNNLVIRDYLNQIIVPAITNLGGSASPIDKNPNLIDDDNAIDQGKTLIANTGTKP